MRLDGRRRSENVDDERGASPRTLVAGGGSIVTIIIVIILAVVFKQDPAQLLQQIDQQQAQVGIDAGGESTPVDDNDPTKIFVEQVLAMTEDVWTEQFDQHVNKSYRKPRLKLFRGVTDSACGQASSAVGPFYCPGDNLVYLDLSFFDEMKTKFRAPGDFAMAYVIAHEIGHHVQNQLGKSIEVQQMQQQLIRAGDEAEANHLSVRVELQADFLAGVWAHHAEKDAPFLEAGDLDEALNAARQIGDDTLQKRARGVAVPDSFTHGTSEQRNRWFKRGFQSGRFEDLEQLFTLPYEKL
ncbi:MAG: neutral zinc metallopeptidase [Pirellulales bacterium]